MMTTGFWSRLWSRLFGGQELRIERRAASFGWTITPFKSVQGRGYMLDTGQGGLWPVLPYPVSRRELIGMMDDHEKNGRELAGYRGEVMQLTLACALGGAHEVTDTWPRYDATFHRQEKEAIASGYQCNCHRAPMIVKQCILTEGE